MYRIILPQKYEVAPLSKLEERLYKASMLDINGYQLLSKRKYCWIVITPEGKRYEVKYKDGNLTCSCPDSKFKAKIYADGWCKHKLFVLTKTELDEIIVMSIIQYPWLTKYLKKTDKGGR